MTEEKGIMTKEEKEELFHSALPLAKHIARKFQCGLKQADILQEGSIGLWKAAHKFNVSRGYKFSTYATWWVRQAIMQAIKNQDRMIRIPTNKFKIMHRIVETNIALFQELKKEPTTEEVAAKMGVDVEKVRYIIKIFQNMISFDAPNGNGDEDEGPTLRDFMDDPKSPSPYREVIKTSLKGEIDKILSTLTPKEEKVLRMRFGIGEKSHTFEEINKVFGFKKRQRSQQIEKKALERIHHPSRAKNLERLEQFL